MSLVTPGVGPVLAPGHNLNKLGRGPLGHATCQIPRLTQIVSDKKIYRVFPYRYNYIKQVTPSGGAIFGPRGKS